jgi:hypothetical protein
VEQLEKAATPALPQLPGPAGAKESQLGAVFELQ